MSSPDHSMVFESAVPSASAARRGTSAPKPAKLSPAALKVAAEPSRSAYSPIVLAGTVRLIEAALVALVLTLFVGPIDHPGTPSGEIALTTGWFVALGADLLILAGSIWRSQESGARRKPPGVL